MTVRETAQRAGVSKATVLMWIRGELSGGLKLKSTRDGTRYLVAEEDLEEFMPIVISRRTVRGKRESR